MISQVEGIAMVRGVVDKLIGNVLELAGFSVMLFGIAVLSYQSVLWFQDGSWTPLEFRLVWEWFERSELFPLWRGAESLRMVVLDLPLAVGVLLCGFLAVYLGKTFIGASEVRECAKRKETAE
jgi:hypothetical protein